jgi:hypothetical protein
MDAGLPEVDTRVNGFRPKRRLTQKTATLARAIVKYLKLPRFMARFTAATDEPIVRNDHGSTNPVTSKPETANR